MTQWNCNQTVSNGLPSGHLAGLLRIIEQPWRAHLTSGRTDLRFSLS